jgi:hypothetical protein
MEVGWHLFQGVYKGTLNYLLDKRTLTKLLESRKDKVLAESGII